MSWFRTRPSIAAAVTLAACAAACASSDDLSADWADVTPEIAAARVDLPAELTASAARLLGPPASPDPDRDEGTWHIGDRALFGVAVAHEDDEQHWLLELRLVRAPLVGNSGPEGSRVYVLQHWSGTYTRGDVSRDVTMASVMFDVEVRVHDVDGELLGTSTSEVPEAFLRAGFHASCHLMAHLEETHPELATTPEDAEVPEDLWRPVFDTYLAATTLFQVLQSNEDLAPILWSVVRRPPLHKLLRLRHTVNLSLDFEDLSEAPEVSDADGTSLPAYLLPVGLEANGSPALSCLLTVVPPSGALRLTGGVVAIEARRPGRDHPRMSVHLLGARPGDGPAANIPRDSKP